MEQEQQTQKPKTSLLYRVSNKHFEDQAIFMFANVVGAFKKGPQSACAFLADIWQSARKMMEEQRSMVDIIDFDKEIKPEDFDVTFNQIPNVADIYFIHFPVADNNGLEYDGACRCLAFALTKDCPRFLTMEYGKKSLPGENPAPCFWFGEWKFNYMTGDFAHLNYGIMERDTIEHFATIVSDKLSPATEAAKESA